MLWFAMGWVWRLVEPLDERLAEIRPERPTGLSGQCRLPILLGGFRPVIAGGFWLRTNLAWERRDAVATRRLLELTVAADERPVYFWLNGARILAYDFPSWISPEAPAAVHRVAAHAGADQALEFLEKGLRWRGPDASVHVEMANIHLHRRNDLTAAAHYYRLAAETPGAPYYAARIHAELLQQLGRPREALSWLRQVLPSLPADDPAARREVVEQRISDLERRLEGR